jgi:hypothetical protein
MTQWRQGSTVYVQVVAEGDTVVEGFDVLFGIGRMLGAVRVEGVIRLPRGPDLDLRSPYSSHNIYPRSQDLERYDVYGRRLQAGNRGECWLVDRCNVRQFKASAVSKAAQAKPPSNADCAKLPLKDTPSVTYEWQHDAPPRDAERRARERDQLHGMWVGAQQEYEQNDVSELIGMKGMVYTADTRGYRLLYKQPDKHRDTKGEPAFGIDGYFIDPATNSMVFGEAKGGQPKLPTGAGAGAGDYLERYILGEGYDCLQGTLGWVKGSLEATVSSTAKSADERKAAQDALDWISKGKPVRVEVFYTNHSVGYPGTTSRLVTDVGP